VLGCTLATLLDYFLPWIFSAWNIADARVRRGRPLGALPPPEAERRIPIVRLPGRALLFAVLANNPVDRRTGCRKCAPVIAKLLFVSEGDA